MHPTVGLNVFPTIVLLQKLASYVDLPIDEYINDVKLCTPVMIQRDLDKCRWLYDFRSRPGPPWKFDSCKGIQIYLTLEFYNHGSNLAYIAPRVIAEWAPDNEIEHIRILWTLMENEIKAGHDN